MSSKSKDKLKMTRRQVLKAGLIGGAGLMMPLRFLPAKAFAVPAARGLSDPAVQPKFVNPVPDALSPGFIYKPNKKGRYKIRIGTAVQQTGLRKNGTGPFLNTPVWGYGDEKDKIITWPGRTFQVQSVSAGGPPQTKVRWKNKLNKVKEHLLPVDTSLHWCYSLPGYERFTIKKKGVPIITHLHGGHSDFQFDGNPEFFYSPKGVKGPQWDNVPGGFTNKFRYDNDVPVGGDIPGPQVFNETDRIMAFDVVLNTGDATTAAGLDPQDDVFDPNAIDHYGGNVNSVDRVRKVALFEGTDEFGRLQPLLGTAEPATDYLGNPINWPNTSPYVNAGLVGQMEGSIAWHSPTTENPALGDTEIWEIYNATGDAHPIHLHLVNFQIGTNEEGIYGPARQAFTADVVDQPVVQHNGDLGNGFRLENIVLGSGVRRPAGYVENAPKDMVTALPGQITRIKVTFDKPGRYVWHCHILSHEDHEMMRVLQVGPGA